jgi:5-methylthioadenosine/S-adenosylhomocysteine deaminase
MALRMSTLNGAKALGLDTQIGSLSIGKQADIVAVDLSSAYTQPCYDVASQLVYSASRNEVSDVWVAGRQVVADRQCLSVDEKDVLNRARLWRDKLAAR